MAKVLKAKSNSYENGDRSLIGGNSVAFTDKCMINTAGGFLILATVGGNIDGIAKQEVTMASDNQTVAKKEVLWEPIKPSTTVRMTVTGGTINATKLGKFYDLATASTVDGLTESATTGQLVMTKFISATLCEFQIVNK
jgi:hypothetical protein